MSLVDKLTIETPEQTPLEFPLAGIGSRFLAIALDTLLQLAAFGILLMIAIAALWASFTGIMGKQWVVATSVLMAFLVQFGYYAFFETIWNGQTPGKRWTHLRVIKDSGRSISAYDAILRNLLRIVDALPTFYATGVIIMLISRENKRVGDYAAGTVVIHEKPLLEASSIWKIAEAPAPLVAINPASQLTVDELQLVETFLERRLNLDAEVRRSIARQIAERLGQRLGMSGEARRDSEKFLEAVAEQRRNVARFH
jgi:uncharacterized RDD family membrane protein YckC